MTRFLIDTHCFLWVAWKTPQVLRPSAAAMLVDSRNELLLSVVSAAEIAVKVRAGKLQLPDAVDRYIPLQMKAMGLTLLPMYLKHSTTVASLPLHHRDPFDLLLVAQSYAEGVPLMTTDRQLAAYDIDIIWAGRGEAPPGARA